MKILFLLAAFCPLALAVVPGPRTPTNKETAAFQSYLGTSGLLRKNHKIKKLKLGPMFKIVPAACRDGDDLYILSFDDGIELEMPEKETIGQFYPNGTGGSWTPVFRRDPKSGYFQFLGADAHHMLTKVLAGAGDCPDLEVGIHGSYCANAGAEKCRGTLKYNQQEGYELQLPGASGSAL